MSLDRFMDFVFLVFIGLDLAVKLSELGLADFPRIRSFSRRDYLLAICFDFALSWLLIFYLVRGWSA
jgi:hypothetical protein